MFISNGLTIKSCLDNDNEISISSCLSTFNSYKQKYRISPEDWEPIENKISHVISKLNDKNLYLGVLGEFSSGKSTLINAILGFEFLKEDVLQGTTCAPTILCQGDKFGVIIHFSDDRRPISFKAKHSFWKIIKSLFKRPDWRDDIQDALALVHQYTADEKFSSFVKKVEIYLPIENELFSSHVAIVDTPGLNSGNKRHDTVAIEAMRDICDTAVILSPAKNSAQKTLIDFVKHFLSDYQRRCILLQTRIDELAAKERSVLLEYVSNRFLAETNIRFAATMAIAAYYVIDRNWDDLNAPPQVRKEIPQFQKDFADNIEKIKDILLNSRAKILVEKTLLILTNDLLPLLTKLISSKKEEYQSRKNDLKNNQLMNFEAFILTHHKLYEETISQVTIPDKHIVETISNLKQSFIEQMSNRIWDANDRDSLKSVMTESVISNVMRDHRNRIMNSYVNLCEPISRIMTECLKKFHDEFSEAYKRLERISQYTNITDVEMLVESNPDINVQIDDFSSAVDTALAVDVAKTMGGAGAGALIGSFILPGLGTAIGAGIGAMFGFLFRKSLDELKGEAYTKIIDISQGWSNQLQINAYAYIQSYRSNCLESLRGRLKNYEEEYGKRIAKLIKSEQQQQKELLALIDDAQQDIDTMRRIEIASLYQLSDNGENAKATEALNAALAAFNTHGINIKRK